jgi:hypothetical protein
MPINSSVFPALTCTSFKISSFILRSLIYLELIHVQSERHVDRYPVFRATFDEEAVFSPWYVLMPL